VGEEKGNVGEEEEEERKRVLLFSGLQISYDIAQ
jgi:hypothetical protein